MGTVHQSHKDTTRRYCCPNIKYQRRERVIQLAEKFPDRAKISSASRASSQPRSLEGGLTHGGAVGEGTHHEIVSYGLLHDVRPRETQELRELFGAVDDGEVDDLSVGQEEPRVASLSGRPLDQGVKEGVLRGDEAPSASGHFRGCRSIGSHYSLEGKTLSLGSTIAQKLWSLLPDQELCDGPLSFFSHHTDRDSRECESPCSALASSGLTSL